MSEKSIELILFRQISSYLSIPTFIVDANSNVIFFNEASEKILGLRFSETGEISSEEWSKTYTPQDKDGILIDIKELPLYNAIKNRRLEYKDFYIRDLNNNLRHIQVSSIPILNFLKKFMGVITFFQEIPE